ncbi:hypothetical protein L293_3854 [Acinetobacter gyllenbergii CIP 110306 = MTCC 11365]|nr:hypothetical protein L293_3854 [Acinetobacter gyllenbergii CIP 110306 = MTCC 11365]
MASLPIAIAPFPSRFGCLDSAREPLPIAIEPRPVDCTSLPTAIAKSLLAQDWVFPPPTMTEPELLHLLGVLFPFPTTVPARAFEENETAPTKTTADKLRTFDLVFVLLFASSDVATHAPIDAFQTTL